MRKIQFISLISVGFLLLSGCDEQGVKKQRVGTLVGAGLGALVGSQIGRGEGAAVATVVGAGLGGYFGNQIGLSMDRADEMHYRRGFNNSMEYNPTGISSSWRNPDSGNHGKFTPKNTYIENGLNCREFIQEVYIAGRKQQAFGKACRMNDGSWKIISS